MSFSLRAEQQEPTGGPGRRTEGHERQLPILSFVFFDLSGFASEFSVGAPGVSRINLRTGTKKRLETCTNLMMVLSLCLPESFCI